ncbi:MAG: hypothetical protein WCP30_01320 [Mycobacteriaceae bacterium]
MAKTEYALGRGNGIACDSAGISRSSAVNDIAASFYDILHRDGESPLTTIVFFDNRRDSDDDAPP